MPKLTADESAGLERVFNIADAHARAAPSAQENEHIVKNLPTMFEEALHLPAREADIRGAAAFAAVSRQVTMQPDQALPIYASSIALEIIANVLRSYDRKVFLVEPTFDNIPDILKRNGVPLEAIHTDADEDYAATLVKTLNDCERGDVLFIVSPNNPTGQTISEKQFQKVCEVCSSRGIDLIIDASFRLFEEEACYDQYAILRGNSVEYICIEDSGKCWPSLDVKLAYICSSDTWRPLIKYVYDDFLLNVSPFVSLVVEAYSRLYLERGLVELRMPVTANRRILRDMIRRGTAGVTLPFASSSVSVELLRLPPPIVANSVVEACQLREVSVLSGEAFYWADTRPGVDLIRIALFRDGQMFEQACSIMLDTINSRMSR